MTLIIGLAIVQSCQYKRGTSSGKPNVLLIFTDQQNSRMMSAAGNQYLKTPAMDKLASEGVMFTQAYCTSPVCGPARSSIITGLMPHETGVEWNGDSMKDGVKNVGEIFREAGYNTVWGGKWHLPESYPQRARARQKDIKGFDVLPFRDPNIENWMLGAETDPPLTAAAVQFLEEYKDENPFFLAVSYHNPHDICFYARKDGWVSEGDSLLEVRYYGFEYQLPEIVGTHPNNYTTLPPLPTNHPVPVLESEFIKDKRANHTEYGLETMLANAEFDSLTWRGYYHAYCRLTEMVDNEIAKVMNALERNGFKENTIVVFTSDHGEGAASHKWAAKLSLYEESSKIPFIVSFPGRIVGNRIDEHHLVSQIDIVPTLCDYAGIETGEQFTGTSLRNIIEDPTSTWREYLVVELADFKPERSRKGRMLRTANHKYNVYNQGKDPEQFFDLANDPGESVNLIDEDAHQLEIEQHRKLLGQWISETADTFTP